MKLQRKGTRHSHRGVIGVESAIVMIAFVIVAAALAFVVLNMGFTTSQKAKTTTLSSLEESSNSLKISGTIIAVGCIDASAGCNTVQKINSTTFPLKISQPGNSVNFADNVVSVGYIGKDTQYHNIYAGPIASDTFRQPVLAFRQASLESGSEFDAFDGANPVNGTLPDETSAFVYWSKNANSNQILESGEHAVLAIAFADSDRPQSNEEIVVEIMISGGSTLTINRSIPSITNSVMDLG